jgi:hypothetical protein
LLYWWFIESCTRQNKTFLETKHFYRLNIKLKFLLKFKLNTFQSSTNPLFNSKPLTLFPEIGMQLSSFIRRIGLRLSSNLQTGKTKQISPRFSAKSSGTGRADHTPLFPTTHFYWGWRV